MTSGVTAEAAYVQLPSLPLGVEVSEGGLVRVPRPLQKGFLRMLSGSPDTPRLGKSPRAEARARLPFGSSGHKKGAQPKPPSVSNEGCCERGKRGCGRGSRDPGPEGSDVR